MTPPPIQKAGLEEEYNYTLASGYLINFFKHNASQNVIVNEIESKQTSAVPVGDCYPVKDGSQFFLEVVGITSTVFCEYGACMALCYIYMYYASIDNQCVMVSN